MSRKRVLLVEPDFPIPPKSRNHHNFLPIGLLKLGAMLKAQGAAVQLVRGIRPEDEVLLDGHCPDEVWITSLFTYWAPYVRHTVEAYQRRFTSASIVVGGIYASLFDEDEVRNYTRCDAVVKGVVPKAENHFPDYSLLDGQNPKPIDYQIIHTSRGCPRRCRFCGTWLIEPDFTSRLSIQNVINQKKLVFYDNNLLMNPHIRSILQELSELKARREISWCESQSGFDGRVLIDNPDLAPLIKAAGFRYPRIAWDHSFSEAKSIEEQLALLGKAGFDLSRDVFVFMVYNWDLPFEEMEKKRIQCWEWGVQIADCRYRPLDQLFDHYRPDKAQNGTDYYIHASAGWTDSLVKQFRRNVREQNICVRHGFTFYSRFYERTRRRRGTIARQGSLVEEPKPDVWVPDSPRYPMEEACSKAGCAGYPALPDITTEPPGRATRCSPLADIPSPSPDAACPRRAAPTQRTPPTTAT